MIHKTPENILANNRKWARANKEKRNEYHKKWRDKNPEIIALYGIKYNKTHPESAAKRTKKWRELHPEKVKLGYKKYRESHPGLNALYCSKRKASKLRATPSWANQFFIEEIYDLAKLRTKVLGFKWHVDHIVPLKSKLVCGLHVEYNLNVIPAIENIRKGNRRWPNMLTSSS